MCYRRELGSPKARRALYVHAHLVLTSESKVLGNGSWKKLSASGFMTKGSPLRMEDVIGPVSCHEFTQKPDGFENHIWVKKI